MEHIRTRRNTKGEKTFSNFSLLSFGERVRWCLSNAYSTRGIGWNWGTARLPSGPPAGLSKISFSILSMKRILEQYVIHDIAAALLLWLTEGGRQSILDMNFALRSLATGCWWTSTIAPMDIFYHIVCLVGVTSGLFWNVIEEVHPLKGSWSACYTLNNFWNRVWHQNFRRALQIPSRFVARHIACIPKGTLMSRQVQSYMAFAISGLYHWVAAKMVVPSQSFAKTLIFFAFMPTIMLLEDLAISFAQKQFGWRSKQWCLLGYVWTFFILTSLGAGFVDDCVKNGLVTSFPALPFSPMYAILNLKVRSER